MKNIEEIFNGLVVQAQIERVTDRDIEKYPILYEHLEPGDIRKIVIEEIELHSADTNPVSALELIKEDIEKLILKLKIEGDNNE